jgi:L,D-peptidoglycan transpeptidase YkuD (ErfK/YbiS/YcfS/YnhG family)
MDLVVSADGVARFGSHAARCAIGRGGISSAKREGDGTTPVGRFVCRWLYWRADRMAEPASRLGRRPIGRTDGWCDDPESSAYNRFIRLPASIRYETLWREDRLYDLLIVLGYNDQPAIPHLGSAIFLHVASVDFRPTEGCVAMALEDLHSFASVAGVGSRVLIGQDP